MYFLIYNCLAGAIYSKEEVCFFSVWPVGKRVYFLYTAIIFIYLFLFNT